ncbi:MAG: hypothetical protein MK364_20025, partial [Pirellulales bacterium]|nr:hypothetical protein [Pirellulales bacterium]
MADPAQRGWRPIPQLAVNAKLIQQSTANGKQGTQQLPQGPRTPVQMYPAGDKSLVLPLEPHHRQPANVQARPPPECYASQTLW